jgi:ankyrin repeat protein
MLNLDAYEPASGRRNPGDRTGFRIFTDTLQMLCTLGDDTDGENAFTKEKCNILYDNVTKGGAGLGRDRSLPIFIQQAFSGWIQKYDKISSLERAIILTPYARTRCHYEPVTHFESASFEKAICIIRSMKYIEAAIHKAICIHIVDVCLCAVNTTPPPKIKDSFKKLLGKRHPWLQRKKTLMDEIFTIDAVREVLTEGFSNAESGRKTSSNILPLVQEKRRGENFHPDVGYHYWHKKEIKITPSDFLKGLSLLLDYGETPLHMAISRSASVDIISLLILGGVDVNLEMDGDVGRGAGNMALYKAVNAGSPEVVELLLEIEDVDVNKANGLFTEGQTPLFRASEMGHQKVVELLLGKDGVDVNKANKNGETPLIMAMQREARGVVELLLGKEGVDVESLLGLKGVDIGVRDSGATPQHAARLLDPDYLNKANENGKTPLLMASQWGHENVVLSLLGIEGVDVDKASRAGETPLWIASQMGHQKVVELLPGKDGVDVKKVNKGGDTPLWIASRKGHQKVVELLLGKDGVDVNKANQDGQTPLWEAVWQRQEKVVLSPLGIEGVDVDKASKAGETPLFRASQLEHQKVVELLLGKDGVDVNKVNKGGDTPLWIASRWGHKKVVELLLGIEGVDVDKADNDGETPLWVAARNGHDEVVKSLLEIEDIDVNEADNDSKTPLWIASKMGKTNIVKLLLGKDGVDVNKANKEGKTPLMVAAHGIVRRLLCNYIYGDPFAHVYARDIF